MVLKVENLHTHMATRAGTVRALDGVDLEVAAGETIGIVGESGSGKTMTALSIMRMVPAPNGRIVDGHIWFEGEDLVTKSEAEMQRIRGNLISMIPQDPMTSLNPLFTVGDQLLESVRRNGRMSKKDAKDRAVELLRDVRIPDPAARLNNYPHEMSGGMRQRVVGAMALAGDPKVIIADEPTTSLDATVQLKYLQLLERIQEETGVAIIFITHDFGVVAKICDKVAVMYAGRIVESGDVRQLFNEPAHPYTRALISSLPTLDEEDTDKLPAIAGQPPEPTNLPEGCSFSPRCPSVHSACTEKPPKFETAVGHESRCWLSLEKTA